MIDTLPQIKLRQQLRGHDAGVRCLAVLRKDEGDVDRFVSGDMAGGLLLWQEEGPDASGKRRFDVVQQFRHHTNTVFTLTAGAKSGSRWTFYSGGFDHRVFRVTTDGEVLKQYNRHSKAVTSLLEFGPVAAVGNFPILLSGSWDGTAIMWNADTGIIIKSLTGHVHAVTFDYLPEVSQIVTSSQDGILRFWTSHGESITSRGSPVQAHSDITRAIRSTHPPTSPCKADDSRSDDASGGNGNVATESSFGCSFLTVSNDESFKGWSANGRLMFEKREHNSFVFDVRCWFPPPIPSPACEGGAFTEPIAATSSEDGTVKIHLARSIAASAAQTLPHPGTVWQLNFFSNGDIVTACDDRTIRLWSADPERMTDALEIEEYETGIAASAAAEAAAQSGDLPNVRDASEKSTFRGKKQGEMALFREQGKVVAYKWTGESWEMIGEVVADPSGAPTCGKGASYYPGDQHFEGGFYDHIFQVDIAEGQPTKPLPYKNGSNTLVAAEKFLARENLSKNYVSEIQKFIQQNSARVELGGTATAPPRSQQGSIGGGPSDGGSTSASPLPRGFHSKFFPALSMVKFEQTNVDAMLKRLLELDNTVPDELQLNETQKVYVREGIARLKSERLLKEEFRDCELDCFFSVFAKWSDDKMLPVMDLWRALSLHPRYSDRYKQSREGWLHISRALNLAKEGSGGKLPTVALRFLANLLNGPSTRLLLLEKLATVVKDLRVIVDNKPEPSARLALASLLLNYALAVQDTKGVDNATKILTLCEAALKEALTVTPPPKDTATLLCIAVGTLLVTKPALLQTAKDTEIFIMAEKLANEGDRLDVARDLKELMPL